MLAGVTSERSAGQDAVRSMSGAPIYFPRGMPNASFFSSFLSYVGEPSLLEAAKDGKTVSYRLIWVSSAAHIISTRLIVNADGSAVVTSAFESHDPRKIHKANISVSVSETERFSQLIDKANFWLVPSTEYDSDDKTRRKVYVLDSTNWMMEGEANGSYHAVFRQSLSPSSLVDVARYLTKDLAKLDDSLISIPATSSPGH